MQLNLKFWKQEKIQRNSRKPLNTSFRQQRLRAWQPNLSPHGILPLLIIIACVFAPLGVGLLVSALRTQTLEIKYEQCHLQASPSDLQTIPSEYVQSNFHKTTAVRPQWQLIENDANNINNLTCHIQFEIPNDIKSSLYVYYKLTNYYQNHRKYIESFDLDQLKGKALLPHQLDKNCKPFKEIDGKAIYPCGVVANTLFNDTFSHELTNVKDNSLSIQLTTEGTAWHTDRHRYKPTKYNASQIVPPPNWVHMFPNGYTEDNIPDLQTWQGFQIWMRTAALPNFYKLSLHNVSHGLKLHKGIYSINIDLNYPVLSFNGTKSFVLTTSHIMGARNTTLGIIYLAIAGLAGLFAIIFLATILLKPKKSLYAEDSYIPYNKPRNVGNEPSITRLNESSSMHTDDFQLREIL